ncbi:unnamed protein product [Paramecium sonneborni]|uniref:Uncharacterized protein n=1 Tax=Paramecium sonneborni TaxID=65129 RepID=A0A8S1RF71_9CILI|nr:unnamed protein product [Paramecium sonneborni]
MQKTPKHEFLQMPSQTKSVNKINMIEVKNEGMIHDVCYDFFGTKIALGSSDGHIEIQEINVNSFKSEQQKDILSYKITDFQHKGPVWQLSWSNPKYGNILASCSFDKTICLFKEQKQGKYSLLLQLQEHKESVQTIQWSYRKFILAAGVADGSVHIYYRKRNGQIKNQQDWEHKSESQHKSCVNQVSWIRDKGLEFASCSTDQTIKIWNVTSPIDGEYKLTQIYQIQCDSWVRSIDWAAEQFQDSQSQNLQLLAAGLESSEVKIFYLTQDQDNNDKLIKIKTIHSKGPCWKVQWSPLGNQLAISTLDDKNDPFIQVYQLQGGNFVEI